MAEAKKRDDVVVLKLVRLAFPKVWKAEKATDTSEPKFSATALIDPDTAQGKENIKAIEAAIARVKKKTWQEKADKIYQNIDSKRKCYGDGDDATNDEGDVYGGFEGMKFLKAANKRRPQILNRDKSALSEEDNVIYGGCYVDMVVSVYAITDKDKGGNGVFATLELIRFRKDGEAFGAAPIDADDYLDDLEEEEDEMI